MPPRPKIALLFRYGPGDHSELFHAMPDIVAALAEHAEVHYYGMRTATPVPETIRRHDHTSSARIARPSRAVMPVK